MRVFLTVLKDIWDSEIPEELKDIAKLFTDLQRDRHDADYRLSRKFSRTEVEVLIERVEKSLKDWDLIDGEFVTDLYLLSLLVFRKVKTR